MYYISIRIIYKLTSACSDKYRIEFEIDKKKKNQKYFTRKSPRAFYGILCFNVTLCLSSHERVYIEFPLVSFSCFLRHCICNIQCTPRATEEGFIKTGLRLVEAREWVELDENHRHAAVSFNYCEFHFATYFRVFHQATSSTFFYFFSHSIDGYMYTYISFIYTNEKYIERKKLKVVFIYFLFNPLCRVILYKNYELMFIYQLTNSIRDKLK